MYVLINGCAFVTNSSQLNILVSLGNLSVPVDAVSVESSSVMENMTADLETTLMKMKRNVGVCRTLVLSFITH